MTEHYFSEAPSGEFAPRVISVELAGANRAVVTAGGVFSPDGIDRGTAVLLQALRATEDGPVDGTAADNSRILDIGCGWGAIALDAALSRPRSEVWAVDVNERARELTALNAKRLGLGNVRVAPPAEVPESLSFAEIRSNPPIRVGKAALHGILRQWLPRLAPGGSASLVVAKHLGAESLQRWIATEFGDFDVARVHRDKGFHVIRVTA